MQAATFLALHALSISTTTGPHDFHDGWIQAEHAHGHAPRQERALRRRQRGAQHYCPDLCPTHTLHDPVPNHWVRVCASRWVAQCASPKRYRPHGQNLIRGVRQGAAESTESTESSADSAGSAGSAGSAHSAKSARCAPLRSAPGASPATKTPPRLDTRTSGTSIGSANWTINQSTLNIVFLANHIGHQRELQERASHSWSLRTWCR